MTKNRPIIRPWGLLRFACVSAALFGVGCAAQAQPPEEPMAKAGTAQTAKPEAKPLKARVTAVENIYKFEETNNGANPFWCMGNSCITAPDDQNIYITSYEKTNEAVPYLNVKWALWKRTPSGWEKAYQDAGRTREPSPVTLLPKQKLILVSANPTLTAPDRQTGPASPEVVGFGLDGADKLTLREPAWREKPVFPPGHYFGEHSYRSFVSDAKTGDVVELHQIDKGDAVWALRQADGNWSHKGVFAWPWGAEYETPRSIRTCYPSTLLDNGAFYFCGVSDIPEPHAKFREAKVRMKSTQKDYDMRRLFFTWSADIKSGKFSDWVEVSSRDKTGGWIWPCDMVLESPGTVLVMWHERALDEALRPEFFPHEKQSWTLNIARIREGKVEWKKEIARLDEKVRGDAPNFARFHKTADGRLFALVSMGNPYSRAEGGKLHLLQLSASGEVVATEDLGQSINYLFFFTAMARTGNPLSNTIHVLAQGPEKQVQYIRIEIQ